jgi:hypothetical protein
VGLSKGPLVYLILFYLDKFFIGLAWLIILNFMSV